MMFGEFAHGHTFLVWLAAEGAIVAFVIVFQFRPRAHLDVDRPKERAPKVSFGS